MEVVVSPFVAFILGSISIWWKCTYYGLWLMGDPTLHLPLECDSADLKNILESFLFHLHLSFYLTSNTTICTHHHQTYFWNSNKCFFIYFGKWNVFVLTLNIPILFPIRWAFQYHTGNRLLLTLSSIHQDIPKSYSHRVHTTHWSPN